MKSSAKRKNPEKWMAEGLALNNLKKYNEAIESFDRILKIDPKDLGALFNKGRALHNLNDLTNAIICYNRVLAFNPKNAKAWRWKGFALRSLERFEEAVKCFDKEIELEPNDDYSGIYWYNKGLMLHVLTDLMKPSKL